MPSTAATNAYDETMRGTADLLAGLQKADVLDEKDTEITNQASERFFRQLRDLDRISGENYWRGFQKLFGFGRERQENRYTPINAANLCPIPTDLITAAGLLRAQYNNNVAQQPRMKGGIRARQFEKVRAEVAAGLKCDPENLAIVRNASEGNNAINCGYRKWATDAGVLQNVVLWEGNHPTNDVAWHMRAEFDDQKQFEVRYIDPLTRDDTPATIRAKFKAKIDGGTRFISYSDTSNASGIRIPEEVRMWLWNTYKNDCHIHIDGTMAFGATRIDVEAYGCHSLVSSGHKWFLGPKQTGILYMAKDRVRDFQPSIFAYNYKIKVPDVWTDMPDNAHRFEMLGQRDDIDLISMYWTQRMWATLIAHGTGDDPTKDPYMRVRDLGKHLLKELDCHAWRLITPVDVNMHLGVFRIEAPRTRQKESLYDHMYKVHRIAGSGGGKPKENETFRLCPHLYNTTDDLTQAVDFMTRWRDEPAAD